MRRKLDRWLALSWEERRLLAGLALLLPAIGIGLRLAGVKRTCRVLLRTSGGHARLSVTSVRIASAKRLGQLVDIASRHGQYRATCLRQSLALWWLLRRRSLPARLRVGVGKPKGRVSAHAWVEVSGVAINPDASVTDTYSPFRELSERLRV